uniref:Uncharacterized protein n=1 Tax=Chromera velia CCMP2878 TaxID=1169474 RepID=A0A0G4HUT0_9ALVE|eukprot:Cvel_31934.t1-p1 / transcript=Cvel_31934.t1 / gene=Cvel_31934 / organism=Chromera_velia_CCMP2878 / gene_product=hypothetical protein / transcript_product=hypothetical protein / location=Cvel_scaffold4854:1828-2304(+) / protein_length=159 / sequence_SO=supercontig / SO=protein_coding / is_pseudo=false
MYDCGIFLIRHTAEALFEYSQVKSASASLFPKFNSTIESDPPSLFTLLQDSTRSRESQTPPDRFVCLTQEAVGKSRADYCALMEEWWAEEETTEETYGSPGVHERRDREMHSLGRLKGGMGTTWVGAYRFRERYSPSSPLLTKPPAQQSRGLKVSLRAL